MPVTSAWPVLRHTTLTCTSLPLTKRQAEIELTAERGRGYVSAVQNKDETAPIGRIPIDSIYSPVLKVFTRLRLLVLSSAMTLTV